MNGSQSMFYLMAPAILTMALMAVTSRRLFRSAVYLLFTLIGIAGIYFLLEYYFIGAVQTVVYVGGIVVLIIFSIFLTEGSGSKMPGSNAGRTFLSGFLSSAGFFGLIYILFRQELPEQVYGDEYTVDKIGTALLETGEGGYLLPFELVSVLLLAAMVACIITAIKENKR